MINLFANHIIMHHELYEEEDCRNYVLLVAMIVMTMFLVSFRMPI